MNINLRHAEKRDCNKLLILIKELAEYEKAPEEVTVTLEHFEESGFGEKPVWWAIVAESDVPATDNKNTNATKEIVGFVLYYIRYSTWKGQRMYLEDFVVTEACRGKGVGKLLFDALIEEARTKKLSGIIWQVLEWNEPAINFYKKYNSKLDSEWINCSINV